MATNLPGLDVGPTGSKALSVEATAAPPAEYPLISLQLLIDYWQRWLQSSDLALPLILFVSMVDRAAWRLD